MSSDLKRHRGGRPARPKHRNGWTPERRARQAALIRAWKPWTRSTGPRSAAGKARVRLNAQRHGFRGARGRLFYGALRGQRQFLRAVARLAAFLERSGHQNVEISRGRAYHHPP